MVVVEAVVISLILPVVFFSLLQMFLDSLNRILVSWLIHTIPQCSTVGLGWWGSE